MAGALQGFVGQYSTDVVLLNAGSLLIMAPTIVVFLIFQRHFSKAMLAGRRQRLSPTDRSPRSDPVARSALDACARIRHHFHPDWWRDAVVYQIYPRSFADANGDGVGDLAGHRGRLPYLADLGVDAIWITPWYPSPMADGGYDVADYRDIDPRFGALGDADDLACRCPRARPAGDHRHGRQPHVGAAPLVSRRAAQRSRVAGTPALLSFGTGAANPANCHPTTGSAHSAGPHGPASSSRTVYRANGFCTFSHRSSRTSTGVTREVRAEFEDILRFWFDRGVDGIRVDAVSAMAKVEGLPDAGHAPGALFESSTWVGNPHWDVDDVHEILREWRKVADSYGSDRMFVAEAVVNGPHRLANYVRPDELHTAFNFDYPRAGWDAGRLRAAIDSIRSALGAVGAPSSWVLSSHDETRQSPGSAVTTPAHRRWVSTLRHPAMCYSAAAGPEPPPFSCSPCLATLTSTRVTNSGCRRSPTCPTKDRRPDLGALRPYRARPRRLSGSAPVERIAPAVRFQSRRCRAVAAATPRVGGTECGAQSEDPVSMLALYRTALRLRREPARSWS